MNLTRIHVNEVQINGTLTRQDLFAFSSNIKKSQKKLAPRNLAVRRPFDSQLTSKYIFYRP